MVSTLAISRTLQDLQNLTLKLINSYSSDGQLLSVSDNADLLLLVNDYLNIAYLEFAQIDKVMSSKDYLLTDGILRPDGITSQFTLPSNFLEVYKLEYPVINSEIDDYSIRGNLLLVPVNQDNLITLWYYKLPDRLSLLTDIPEIRSQYHDYLAYYASGTWLLTTGNQSAGIDLLTLYDDSKDAIIPAKTEGIRRIKTVFGMW